VQLPGWPELWRAATHLHPTSLCTAVRPISLSPHAFEVTQSINCKSAIAGTQRCCPGQCRLRARQRAQRFVKFEPCAPTTRLR
jgi:hypothetical protein